MFELWQFLWMAVVTVPLLLVLGGTLWAFRIATLAIREADEEIAKWEEEEDGDV